ncbi:MAG: M23 family metallopeptidase [Ferruginibacter sp.]
MLFASCGSSGLLANKNAREKYHDKVVKKHPAQSAAWQSAAAFALKHPLAIPVPYAETGIFGGDRPDATGFYFTAKKGQKISISLKRTGLNTPTVFTELFEAGDLSKPAFIKAADTSFNFIEYVSPVSSNYILRIQPALGGSGRYELRIIFSPELGFPVDESVKSHIGSLWGDPRDGGKRKHEGIDIMAAKGSPVLAVADGIIDYVEEDELGGKVISLKPFGRSFSVYYAHLDKQLVSDGQRVKKGQQIGTVGNTGNARNTVPHLHFGIYLKNGSATDPLVYVQKTNPPAEPVSRPLNEWYQTSAQTKLYPSPARQNAYKLPAPVKIKTESCTKDFYRVLLENGAKAFVAVTDIGR